MHEEITCKFRDKNTLGRPGQLRRGGLIPAAVYGKGISTMHLILLEKEFNKTLGRIKGENILIDLKIEEEKSSRPVIIKEIQKDPVTSKILHVDFQVIRLSEKMKIRVPISVKGEAPGAKAGGILQYILREIEIECLPKDIPEKIEVNISNLEIGDVIHLKDVKLPPDIVAMDDGETSILSVVPPKLEKEEAPPEEAITEPEVIKREKKEEEVVEEAAEKEEPQKAKPDQKK